MSNTWPVARDGQLENDISAILISLAADNERNKMPLPRISARIPMTVLASTLSASVDVDILPVNCGPAAGARSIRTCSHHHEATGLVGAHLAV
jgi:hypothetical protein